MSGERAATTSEPIKINIGWPDYETLLIRSDPDGNEHFAGIKKSGAETEFKRADIRFYNAYSINKEDRTPPESVEQSIDQEPTLNDQIKELKEALEAQSAQHTRDIEALNARLDEQIDIKNTLIRYTHHLHGVLARNNIQIPPFPGMESLPPEVSGDDAAANGADAPEPPVVDAGPQPDAEPQPSPEPQPVAAPQLDAEPQPAAAPENQPAADIEPPVRRSPWQRARDWGSGRGVLAWWNTRRTPFREREDVFERDGRYYRRVPGDAVIAEDVPDNGYAVREDVYDEYYEDDRRRRLLGGAALLLGGVALGYLLFHGKRYGYDHETLLQERVHDLQGDVNNLQSNVHDLKGTVHDLQGNVQDLQIDHAQEMDKLNHINHVVGADHKLIRENHHLLAQIHHEEAREAKRAVSNTSNNNGYRYPWNWAKSEYGASRAETMLHKLGARAMEHGHRVKWIVNGFLPNGAHREILEVDGTTNTSKVIQIVSQYR
jgi:hypothetical protein